MLMITWSEKFFVYNFEAPSKMMNATGAEAQNINFELKSICCFSDKIEIAKRSFCEKKKFCSNLTVTSENLFIVSDYLKCGAHTVITDSDTEQ